MSKSKSRSAVMKKLSEKFGLDVAEASEFYGRTSDGIWIKNAYVAGYGYEQSFDMAHPLNKAVAAMGWFIEPYDSETMMVHAG